MKSILLVLNLMSISLITYLIIDKGMPDNAKEGSLLICFLLVPILNILYIFNFKEHLPENWLSLYLKRKKLEEQLKIKALEQ